ncbi:MAG: hypothetical protein LQ344_004363 [Seirophora lacunosa]|nr:MAG: hypothetical protein LQ344_004363 [Seirophora lacunosa]
MEQSQQPRAGDLSWRLSSHPITLLFFLGFRIFSSSTSSARSLPRIFPLGSILVFILTILLLAADFYYLKNIAGRRLVGLRWWNEVDSASVIALILTITNTLAFSRCDKFSQASSLASSAMYSGGMAKSLAGGLFGRFFRG